MFCTTPTASGLSASRLIWVYGPRRALMSPGVIVTCDILPRPSPSSAAPGALRQHPRGPHGRHCC